MKRARAIASYSGPNPFVSEEVLDLENIILCITPTFIEQNMDAKEQELIQVKFDVFPDATMGKNYEAFQADNKTVFISRLQYELLIDMHSKVLTTRLKQMELGCTLTTGACVSYDCFHRKLYVKEGYATWEISVKFLSE